MKFLFFTFVFYMWTTTITFAEITITPVQVTSTIQGDVKSSARYLISDNPSFDNDTPLQRSNGTGVTLPSGTSLKDLLSTFHLRNGLGEAESWTQKREYGHPVFVFDLTGGENAEINSIILWQYGNTGGKRLAENDTKNFRLLFHTKEQGNHFDFSSESIGFSGQMKKAGRTTTQNPAQQFVFPAPKKARYVAMMIDSNFGHRGTPGKRYGLGEVRFSSQKNKIYTPTQTTTPTPSDTHTTTPNNQPNKKIHPPVLIAKKQPPIKTKTPIPSTTNTITPNNQPNKKILPPTLIAKTTLQTKKESSSLPTRKGLLSLFAPLLLLFRKKN